MSLINGGVRGHEVADELWRKDERGFILSHADAIDYEKVLDCGGSNGSYSASLFVSPRGRLYVVDTKTPSKTGKHVNFVKGDIRHLPFRDNTFDIVFARSVLHHVPNEFGASVSELHRVTKQNGLCIVSEPLSTWFGRVLRRIQSTYHDPGEQPCTYDELFTSLSLVFPCGTGKGFGVFAPWLSYLSFYVWIPKCFIRALHYFDRWLIKNGFYTLVYQMVWIMEKHDKEG